MTSDARAGQRESNGWCQNTPQAEERPNITSSISNEGSQPLFSSSLSTLRSDAPTTRQQGDPPFSPPLPSSRSITSDVRAVSIPGVAAALAMETDSVAQNNDDAFTDEPKALPPFTPACASNIRRGNLKGDDFCHAIMAAYHEAVHWQRNIFLTPSGAEGKEFIQEMAQLLQAYAEGSAMASFALTAAMTMPLLPLQKPHHW